MRSGISDSETSRFFCLNRTSDVPGIAQAVTQEVESEQGGDEQAAGEGDQPPINSNGIHLVSAFGDERSPTGHRGLNAQAEITQERFVEDDRRDGQRYVNNDNPQRVGNDMPSQNANGAD